MCFEQAYDERSACIVEFDSGFNLYLRYIDHLLAVVCVIKDSSFMKKGIIDINFMVLKYTYEKIVKDSEKIIHGGDGKK